MPQNTTANYMFAKNYKNVTSSDADSLTSSLDSALLKYNESSSLLKSSTVETKSLISALEDIRQLNSLHKEKLLLDKSVLSSMADAVTTFNIYPSDSYEKYTSVLKWKSDAEAIQSDWVSVGNDLKLSWASLLLQELHENDAKE